MPKFALRYPFFVIMLCLMVSLVGVVNTVRMPVDLFPRIDMPVVVVATFYNGMPPEQIEADIKNTFERFLTLGANIDHSESRSLTGVSLIKIYVKPGTDPNAALDALLGLDGQVTYDLIDDNPTLQAPPADPNPLLQL